MKPSQFGKRLSEDGFARVENALGYHHCYQRQIEGRTEVVILENSMGGAYYLFLGRNCVPRSQPAALLTKSTVEAESPPFEYVEKEEKEETLQRAWDWLTTIGYDFLREPHQKELHRWITEDRIIVRDGGVVIPIPRERRLP